MRSRIGIAATIAALLISFSVPTLCKTKTYDPGDVRKDADLAMEIAVDPDLDAILRKNLELCDAIAEHSKPAMILASHHRICYYLSKREDLLGLLMDYEESSEALAANPDMAECMDRTMGRRFTNKKGPATALAANPQIVVIFQRNRWLPALVFEWPTAAYVIARSPRILLLFDVVPDLDVLITQYPSSAAALAGNPLYAKVVKKRPGLPKMIAKSVGGGKGGKSGKDSDLTASEAMQIMGILGGMGRSGGGHSSGSSSGGSSGCK